MRLTMIVLALLLTTAACKKRAPESSFTSADNENGISLSEFDYEPSSEIFIRLAERVGCEQAKKWTANPRRPIKDIINELRNQQSPYDFLRKELFNPPSTPCTEPSTKKSDLEGMSSLYKKVSAKGFGLTFVMIGGLGSHLSSTGALPHSIKSWNDTLPKDSFRAVRIECLPNSYAKDEICAVDIQKKIEQLIASELGPPHVYFFWGFSKGAPAGIYILNSSQKIRDKTLAFVSMGGAFGGGVTLKQIVPLLDRFTTAVQQTSPLNRAIIETLGAYGAGIAASKNPESDVASKVAYMLSPTEFPTTKEGVTSMLPRNKAKFLRETLPTWNLSRSTPHPFTGKLTTHIFQVSSVVDISNFNVTPNVTITDEDKIGYDMASLQTQQAIQLATAYEFSHHPLSDTCVALEHSVLPKFALPKGATSELLGLIQVDHSGLGFSDPQTPNRAPGLPIVDSIVETVSRKLGGQP